MKECAVKRRIKKKLRSEIPFATTKELLTIKNKYSACVYCSSPDNLTIEHIISINRGGFHTINNLAMACEHCNCSKRDLLINEWLNSKYCQENNITWERIHPDIKRKANIV